MPLRWLLCVVVAVFSSVTPLVTRAQTAAPPSARELAGLWEAKRSLGPDVRGTLLIRQRDGGLWAEISGKTAQAKTEGDAITFELPGGENAFRGKFDARRTQIVGHWIQPATPEGGPYASPVTLTKNGRDTWRGEVTPLDSAITLYLSVKAKDDGAVSAFLKNPERNIGWVGGYRIDGIEFDGSTAKLSSKGKRVVEGKYDAQREVLSIYFPYRGGTFDFRRVRAEEASNFYPRGRPSATYVYAPPPASDDGWPTASLEDVGISRELVEKFIRMVIDTPIESVHSPEVHGVLIARHGKLVLEEYFHGEHRDKPHDTRSASKSLTATLIGAAMNAGVPLKASSPVYQVINGGAFPPGLEPRKRALTLEHLLTMSSGLDCDDSDDNSPGREDYMVDESGATDYYKYTMALKMIREPGERAVYCSVQPNLAGGVLKHAAGRSIPELMQDLLARPLQIKRYYLGITPNGDTYMGGGARLLPRDFMKLAQLHLNGGTWNGRRVLTREWVERSTAPLYKFSEKSRASYGYLWWVFDYPYKGRTVRAYFASGNGWQHAIAIPELDLVIGFYGGNYGDDLPLHDDYVPKQILPAVLEGR
ncbi:MAG TPA: serine hydrolase [Pyrinomonadaceae bacterium]|nr:serine hydrolase [Pyrinomonadaceae bacterium]